jgi:transposase
MPPRQVRDFGRAGGKLAKTDAISAAILAHFGGVMRPPVRPLPDALTQELQHRLARRRQLVEMMTAEQNRLAGAPLRVQKQIRAHVVGLRRQLKSVEADAQGADAAPPGVARAGTVAGQCAGRRSGAGDDLAGRCPRVGLPDARLRLPPVYTAPVSRIGLIELAQHGWPDAFRRVETGALEDVREQLVGASQVVDEVRRAVGTVCTRARRLWACLGNRARTLRTRL